MGKTKLKCEGKRDSDRYPPTDLLTHAITAERVGFDYIVDCSPAS
jgi:hypothetical protein